MNRLFDTLRKKALELPETLEVAHFDNISFTVRKKIFATLNPKANRACFKLSELDQHVFSKIGNGLVYPVPNKWGKHGWTNAELGQLEEELLLDLIITAYCEVAPAKLKAGLKEQFGDSF